MPDPDDATLFNHDAQHCYPGMDALPGINYYASRALALSAPGDTVQLPAALADEYPSIMDHYAAAGIECAHSIEWTLEPSAAAKHPRARHSVYLFRPVHERLRPNPRRLAATDRFEDKNQFIEFCHDHGYPVPATRTFRAGQRPRLAGLPLPAVVKHATDANGVTIRECTDTASVEQAAAAAPAGYQVQESLTASAFLNVQYRAAQGRAEHIATTEQVLRGFRHIGSQHPAPMDPRAVTDPLAQALAREGLEDMLGIDIAVTGRGPLLLEVNARYNSASYPAAIARSLGANRWLAVTMTTRHRSISQLARALGSLMYDPRDRSGAVLVNWGPILVGAISVLLVSDDADLEALRDEVAAAIS